MTLHKSYEKLAFRAKTAGMCFQNCSGKRKNPPRLGGRCILMGLQRIQHSVGQNGFDAISWTFLDLQIDLTNVLSN